MCIFIVMLLEGGEQRAQTQTYMKEYLCYDFAIHSNTPVPIRPSIEVEFQQCRPASTQPAAIIDSLQEINTLYLLQWDSKDGKEILYVRQLVEQDWIRIDMNHQPEHVRISGGKLFLLSGRQLHIVDLETNRTVEKEIERHEVIAVNSSLVQVQGQKESTFEAGISIIYFQQGIGYLRRSYSINSSITRNIFTSVTQMAKKISTKSKQPKYLHFEVIIPNILALGFTNNGFKVYNLHDMQQSQFEGRLNFGNVQVEQKPIVKWQRNYKLQGYNETLQILIGIGGFIEIFFISFVYYDIPDLKEQSVADLVQGNLINWDNINIYTFISLSIEGGYLVDMALSKKGVGYYSKDLEKSQIGYCRYTNIDLEALSSQIPILSQQAIVWRNYYQDKKTLETTLQLDSNRFYNPNRYSTSFILDQPQDKLHEKQLQILTDWRKKYSFKAMIVYNEDMIIVRTGSLSVSRSISEKLYKFENFTEEHLQQLEQIHISGETDDIALNQLFIEETIDEYDEPLFYTEIERPRLPERKYHDQQDIEIKVAADLEATYAFESFNTLIQANYHKENNSLKIQQLKEKLIEGLLRDRLNYYSLTFNSKTFFISSHQQRQGNKEYDMKSYITRFVDYFHGLSSRSQAYCSLFGHNLLSLFVQHHSQSLSNDIDYSLSYLLQKMFKFLLPKRIPNYQNSIVIDTAFEQKFFTNSFIEFLVETLIHVLNDQKEYPEGYLVDKEKLLRDEMKKIIGLGVLDYRELNFSQHRRNKSILKMLFLCNLPEKLQLHSSQFLVSTDNSIKLLQQYVEMKPYMKIEDIQIMEKCVLINRMHRQSISIKFDPSSFAYPNQYNLSDDLSLLIYNNYQEYISRQYWSSQTLYEQDNSSLICSLFTQIENTSDQKLRDKLLVELQKAVQKCCINSDEKKLEYYELMLCGYVKLFNRTVDRQDCDSDSDQFDSYRKKLCNILKKINDYFLSYKQIYYQFYEDENERNQQSRFDQLKKEEELMNSVFLDQRPILLLQNNFFNGLICSTYSLDLLRLALQGQINSDQQFEKSIYQSYISNASNLTGFWLNKMIEFPRKAIKQTLFYTQMICRVNQPGLIQYFKIFPDDWQNLIQSIPQSCHRDDYTFIDLFFEQDSD